MLRELMDANGLRQKDLADDLGGESIVSLILKEKRQLNRQQIQDRRRPIHFAVTSNPTAEWTARQLLAFPGTTPRAICCATGTAFMERSLVRQRNGWVFRKS